MKENRYVNNSYNNKIYVLNNDEILVTEITVNRSDVKSIIQELLKLSINFEIKTEDELIEMYGLNFKFFAQSIGEFNLDNKKLFKKTKNYIMPENLHINLFYDLAKFYNMNDDEILIVPRWIFKNLTAHYISLQRINSNLISMKHIKNAKMELITDLYIKFNIEVLNSFSCSEAEAKAQEAGRIYKNGELKWELKKVIHEAKLNKKVFDKFDLKIGKEKQLKKHK